MILMGHHEKSRMCKKHNKNKVIYKPSSIQFVTGMSVSMCLYNSGMLKVSFDLLGIYIRKTSWVKALNVFCYISIFEI